MARIVVNGVSAKGGGGKSVLRNLLKGLAVHGGGHCYKVLVPPQQGYEELASDRVAISVRSDVGSLAALGRFSLLGLPRELQEVPCDLLLNTSDIVVPTMVPQLFLFDWSYAAFPDSPAWRMGSIRDRCIRRLKLQLFRRHARYANVMMVQTPLVGRALANLYCIRDIEVVPNAVALENLSGGVFRDFGLGDGFKFLCLSSYYSHKNLEVFLPVARLLRERRVTAKIVITLAGGQHPAASRLLAAIAEEKLGDFVVNVGPVPMANVPSLYAQTDALLLPTLLESFSGTYVEAMFHRRPILTSDLPFAADVCGDAALYFNPCDPSEIVDAIRIIRDDESIRVGLVERGRLRLASMPDWPTTTARIVGIIERILG